MAESTSRQTFLRWAAPAAFVLAACSALLGMTSAQSAEVWERAQVIFGILTTITAAGVQLPEEWRRRLFGSMDAAKPTDAFLKLATILAVAVAVLIHAVPAIAEAVGIDASALSGAFGGLSAFSALLIKNFSDADATKPVVQ